MCAKNLETATTVDAAPQFTKKADVSKVLGSVSKFEDAGNTDVFSRKTSSYIENDATGARTQLYRENGVYYFDMWIPIREDLNAISGFNWPDEVF